MLYPKMVTLEQDWQTRPVVEIEKVVQDQLDGLNLQSNQLRNKSICITAGSRGIANQVRILREIVLWLRSFAANPFIVPSMGSHGGATAEGQQKILDHYGINEATVGAPVKSSMEVVQVGVTEIGLPVYLDRHAATSDGIVIVNRVKPHTEFEAAVESGLMKMLAIGLGKQQGADILHRAVIQHGYYPIITSAARKLLSRSPVLCGVGLVENQKKETAIIEAFHPKDIENGEEALLLRAKELMPGIPFDRIDLLIVDEIGKDISGTGMDPNIIGRPVSPYATAPAKPKITRILVRDLTAASQGNADGIGLADFTTRRLVEKMDRTTTYIGATTGGAPEGAKIPVYYDTDKQAVETALNSIGWVEPEKARIVRIQNTLKLEKMLISTTLKEAVENRPGLRLGHDTGNMTFDQQGNLV